MLQNAFVLALTGLATLSTAAPTSMGKREAASTCRTGLAYDKGTPEHLDAFPKDKWIWNWDSKMSQKNGEVKYSKPGYEFVPMLHDNRDVFTDAWHQDVEKAKAAGSTHIMSFNEPDQMEGGGTQLYFSTVEATVAAHKEWIDKEYKNSGLKIGSPSVTNGKRSDPNGKRSDMGIDYLERFINQCTDCQIDFVCLHWYNGGSISDFKSYLTDAYNRLQKKPIWLTEWKAPNDDLEFIKEAKAFMASSGFVERESMFSVETALYDGAANQMTPLGKAYTS